MKKESRTKVGSKISSKVKKIQMRPMAYIAMAFFIVIFLGSLLLYFPFTHNDGVSISYLDALFTSMSATCVTGLITIPAGVAATFNTYSNWWIWSSYNGCFNFCHNITKIIF